MCLHCNSCAGEGEHVQDAILKWFTYTTIHPALEGGDGMRIRHSQPALGVQIVQGQSRPLETLFAFNPAHRGQSQADLGAFEANLVYTECSRPARATQ